MGRPLPQLLIFFALMTTIFSLVPGSEVTQESNRLENVTLSSEQNTFEADPDTTAASIAVDWASCVLGPLTFGVTTYALGQGFVCDPLQNLWNDTIGETQIGKAITTVTEGLGDFVRLVGQVLSFGVPGAPAWFRWPFAMVLSGVSAYIVISLVRGAG